MSTEQERADFEAWYRDTYNSTLYCEARFEGWQAGRAALQSQVNSEAADRVREFLDKWMQIRLNDKTAIYRLNDLDLRVDDLRALITTQSQDAKDAERYRAWRKAVASQNGNFLRLVSNELPDWDEGAVDEEKIDAAIDHASRVEGDGK